MHRYFLAAFLGALAGLILNAAIAISGANYPDLPRPDFYRVGAGPYAELQDRLMDQELALYVCQHLASEGFDFVMRGALAGVLAIYAFNQFGDCWLRRSLLAGLIKVLTCKYAIAMVSGLAIFSSATYLTNVRCPFLSLSCVLNNGRWWTFLLCGLFPLLLIDLMHSIRKRSLNVFDLFSHVLCMGLISSVMCGFWPDLINPIAYNTASIMGYNTREYFGAMQCGTVNFSVGWIPVLVDSVLLLFMVYVVLETSRVVLTKHVFEPLLKTFIKRPTFFLLTKLCTLGFLVFVADFALADACARVVPLRGIYTIYASSPKLIRLFELLDLELVSNDVHTDGGDCYNHMYDSFHSNCFWITTYKRH